jgi:ribosomal protein S14
MNIYTKKEYEEASQKDLLALQCDFCHSAFYRKKKYIQNGILQNVEKTFCSKKCQWASTYKQIEIKCVNCQEKFMASAETNRRFCSKSCSVSYNNKNRKDKYSPETKQKISRKLKKYYDGLPERDKLSILKKRRDGRPQKIKRLCKKCENKISPHTKFSLCRKCFWESDYINLILAPNKKYKKEYVFNKWDNTNVYLMSGLEILYYKYLTNKNIRWARPKPLTYLKDGRCHLYFPDFLLLDDNRYIEIKGYMRPEAQEKMNLIFKQYKDIKLTILYKNDVKLLMKDCVDGPVGFEPNNIQIQSLAHCQLC